MLVRKSWLAIAGITTGLASMVTPAAAYASTSQLPSQVDPSQTDDVGIQAVCASWTDYITGPGYPYNVYIPSPTRNDDNPNCTLRQGNQTDGVYKLQDALNLCYGQGLARDGAYGPATRQAVINVQRFHGLPADGIYGPQTRAAMTWPKYRTDNTYDHCWR